MGRMPTETGSSRVARQDGVLRLHCNESAYPPPPAALGAATEELDNACTSYPDSDCAELRERVAEYHGLKSDMVVVGNGADELVLLTSMTFLGSDDAVLVTDSTFPGYVSSARAAGARVHSLPLDDYRVPVDAVVQAMAAPEAGAPTLVFVCNPHNPAGTVLEPSDVERILTAAEAAGVIPVFDEAYMEFAGPDHEYAISAVRAGRRLLVLRTFSKAWGLASLRLGCALGPADLVERIRRTREPLPFSVNRIVQQAGAAALESRDYVDEVRRKTVAAREHFCARLTEMGVAFQPSATNFVLVKPPGNSAEIAARLKQDHDILVRDLNMFGLPAHLRVTVGTTEQMDRFCAALATILEDSEVHNELNTGLGAPKGRIQVATGPVIEPAALFNGYVGANVVFALTELNVWQHLQDGARPFDALPPLTGAEPSKLLALLRAAALLGYVEVSSAVTPSDPGTASTVALTDAGRVLARHRGFFTWGVGGYSDVLLHLSDLATGRATFGTDVDRDGGKVAVGSGLVGEELMLRTEHAVVADVDFGTVADLGCGDASRLIRLCGSNEARTGLGIDTSRGACEKAVKRVADAGLGHRVEVVCADVLDVLDERTFPGVELVTSFLMMHDLFESSGDPAGTMRMLRKVFPDAKWFLVGDTVSQDWGTSPSTLPIFSVEFELVHAFMDTPIASRRAYEDAFAAAGLRVQRREPFGAPSTWLWLLAAE